MTKKKRKPRASPAGIVSNPANQETYKDLVFKWMLEAYPESLSRIEIAGKLRAHPQRVKALIVTPLCKEGRIFKWGQKTAPYERYMPNVKAPEYYEVTGEKPPTMPSVNEQEFLKRVHPGLFGDHMQKKKSTKKGKDPPGMTKDEASQQQQEESSLGEETVKAQRSWADLFDIDEVEDEAADDDDDELEATEFLEDDEEDLSDDELDEYEDEGDGELSAEEGDEEDKDTAQARIKGQRFQGQNGARVQDAASKR